MYAVMIESDTTRTGPVTPERMHQWGDDFATPAALMRAVDKHKADTALYGRMMRVRTPDGQMVPYSEFVYDNAEAYYGR